MSIQLLLTIACKNHDKVAGLTKCVSSVHSMKYRKLELLSAKYGRTAINDIHWVLMIFIVVLSM